MPGRLAGKSAIVTGSGNGIGQEIAKMFASEGASVLVVDREVEAAAATVEAIVRAGGKAAQHVADISDRTGAPKIVEAAVAHFGKLDILINNAAIVRQGTILETPLEMWDEVIAVNLTGTFLCAQAAAREMVKAGYGRIVNVSSHAGLLGSMRRAAYAASKGGVLAMTRQLAVDLADHGITVNAIAPGNILTRNFEKIEPERRKAWESAIPMRRIGETRELAAAALFLASDEASYVTGQTISVDGGFTIKGLMQPRP